MRGTSPTGSKHLRRGAAFKPIWADFDNSVLIIHISMAMALFSGKLRG